MKLMRGVSAVVAVQLASAAAWAQGQLYGIRSNGDVLTIDRAAGAAAFVGNSGFGCNAASHDGAGAILTMDSPFQIVTVNAATGAGAVLATLSNAGVVGYGPRGLAVDSTGAIWVAMSQAATTGIDILARVNVSAGGYTLVGPTGVTDIQGLAFDANDNLFALGIQSGGRLLSVNKTTGAATVIGGGAFGGDDQAIEFDDAGALFAARDNLLGVNAATGAATVIGALGFTDVRGLAFIPESGCYPDCNTSGNLTVADFGCFQGKYVLGDLYADCNQSGTLTVADFGCFQGQYVIGCP
ncbi:MAG: hypothetical protein ACKVU4_01840 [Phycisphaerales bacterium]